MSECTICAVERNEKSNKVRREGFIPGVVYGKGVNSKSVKFESKQLKKLLDEHGKNARISLKIGDEVNQCILKEVQKDWLNGQILNVEFQAVHSGDMIHSKVPVIFHGKEKLSGKQLLLQEYVSEIEIQGKAEIMPESVSFDVGDSKLEDKITVKDIQVEPGIKILNSENEIIAVITAIKSYDEESEEEA
jgi:large subunit ribosomal protein L25